MEETEAGTVDIEIPNATNPGANQGLEQRWSGVLLTLPALFFVCAANSPRRLIARFAAQFRICQLDVVL